MNDETKSLENIEFETKYRAEDQNLIVFKQIIDNLLESKSFRYLEGPDAFFTYPKWWFDNNPQWDIEGTFARYRKPSYGLDDGKKQVTWKYKPKGAKNSIQRTEYNFNLNETTSDSIVFGQMEDTGMVLNCSIIKNCHIYKLESVTLVWYTVYDTTDGKPKKADNFIEIEIDEAKIVNMTESQAWETIVKYEKILEPVGVNAQKRLKKSLFELYRRNK
jgi:hypothetical protein